MKDYQKRIYLATLPFLPFSIRRLLGRMLLTTARRESNRWLRKHAVGICGQVLSIGSSFDQDGEGQSYRSYFKNCSSYITSDLSDVSSAFRCDMILDVRSMPQIPDKSFDCVFCSGVIEHVDDYSAALKEITRILKPGATLLLGLPFRQALHMAPSDYWRFTEYGVKFLLQQDYEIEELVPVDDDSVKRFPSAYWVKAKKR